VLWFDSFAVTDFTFVYTQTETTVRISTGPRFENDCRSLLSIIRKWYQFSCTTLLTVRKFKHPICLHTTVTELKKTFISSETIVLYDSFVCHETIEELDSFGVLETIPIFDSFYLSGTINGPDSF
jgi:hypothetical protein